MHDLWLVPGGLDKITCSNYCWRCIHFTMAFCIEKRNTWPQQTVVYFDLFRSCLLYTCRNCTAPSCTQRYTETGGEEEIAGINNPPLAAAASDSVAVATSKLLTESHQQLVSSTDWFWQIVFSCRGSLESKLSVPNFVSHCLEIFSKAARQDLGRKAWVRGYWRWLHA